MRFEAPDYVVLIVADLDRSLEFYCEVLGLPLGHRSGAFAQLRTGRTRLALYTRGAMSETLGFTVEPTPQAAPGFEIGFKVDDVDSAYEMLIERGAEACTPPVTRAWGQRTAYLRDPDGHLVELAQQLERPPA